VGLQDYYIAVMRLATYTVNLAALLAILVLPSTSQLAEAPFHVILSLSDDLVSIKAEVVNLGAEVSGFMAYAVPSD
jgi:hypothetical protein